MSKTKISSVRHPAAINSGFTLIEILVAMFVLAIGLLGVAALQLRGLQFNNDAHIRGQVSVLASGIADRMRSNSTNAADYLMNNYLIPATLTSTCSETATVTAANDIECWKVLAKNTLPTGSQLSITSAAITEGTEYTVAIRAFDRTTQGLGTYITYSFLL